MPFSPLAVRVRLMRRARALLSRAMTLGWLAAVALAACTGERVTAPDPVTMVAPTTTFEVGGSVQLSLLNARGVVTWTSSNSAVATVVSTGFVTAVGPGTTTITASTPTQSTSVELTVVAPPALELGATTVSFAARAGGANPPPQTVALRNSGGGTVSGLAVTLITYFQEPASWLTATVSGPSATAAQPAQLQLSASVGTLAPGTYSALVTIASSAAGGARELPVTLVVGAPPTIVLSRATAEFTLSAGTSIATPTMVDITAGLSGDVITGLNSEITYPSGEPTGWLMRTLSRSDTPAQSGLTVDATTLAPGTYRATLEISSPMAANSPQRVEVTMDVTEPPRAVLSATTATINALAGGGNPAPVAIGITNGGGGTLPLHLQSVAYAAGQPTGWLSAVLSSTTAPSTLTLLATPGALAAGTYSATVQLGSGGGAATPPPITVTLVVTTAARIGVSRTTVAFAGGVAGANPAAETVTITNSAGGVLDQLSRSVEYGVGATGWLTNSLNTTTAPAVLSLQPVLAGLTAGTYTATVRVASPAAENSPVAITVTLVVSSTPSIGLSRTTVPISALSGAIAPAEQVSITNVGGATLTGLTAQVAAGASWLSASLNTQNAPATLTLSASSLALSPGTYNTTVTVASPVASNSPRTIAVTFTVGAPPPAIALNVTSRTFTAPNGGGNPAAQSVVITNGGGGTLSGLTTSISYGSGSGWLSASLSATSITTGSSTLTLTATTGTLTAGTRTATVTIASGVAGVASRQVTVTFTVPAASIGLSSTIANLNRTSGTGSTSVAITVSNAGAGTLSGLTTSIVTASPWLSRTLSVTSVTTGTSTLTITANAGTAGAPLAPGTYSGTIRVSSPVAASRDITVNFTVPVSLANNIWPRVNNSGTSENYCGSCHFSGQLNMTTASAFRSSLVGVGTTGNRTTYPLAGTYPTRIVAGNATLSYLTYQLQGSANAHRMPTSPASLLSVTTRNYIRDWINQGASNN
jgi:large repetitive protein